MFLQYGVPRLFHAEMRLAIVLSAYIPPSAACSGKENTGSSGFCAWLTKLIVSLTLVIEEGVRRDTQRGITHEVRIWMLTTPTVLAAGNGSLRYSYGNLGGHVSVSIDRPLTKTILGRWHSVVNGHAA
jgi:hypothetical protein